jgi:hypothetical protein
LEAFALDGVNVTELSHHAAKAVYESGLLITKTTFISDHLLPPAGCC